MQTRAERYRPIRHRDEGTLDVSVVRSVIPEEMPQLANE